uniref:RING finger protein 17 n=1 Tax=Taeniopygia guttata TaxID=59729 RepID=A0A674H9R7_TAEGU|nr:RING finger protein 17 isoform X1 [Taeniopygia guttata]XP_030131665.3 RING finger protein 17 isoform X1 [Taeniopygia guttata]XP_030131674.3 RING finger protein 17 isoform X1 [Taeniopygia guttata]
MSGRREFSLLDDSNKELPRSRMKGVRQCPKLLEENFAEPHQRNGDLHHISKALSAEVLHGDGKDEDTGLFCFSSPEENKTGQDIDEALSIAISNLGHFQEASKVLEYLELKVKHKKEKVTEAADRTLDELITLLSRKRKSFAELKNNINNYSSSIAKTKEVIKEKTKHLIGAIRTAKELKFSHSLRNCCDLAQIIYDLKLPVEAELSRVKNLQDKILSRLFMNTSEITSSLENLGEIKQGMTTNEDNGQDTLILDGQEETPDVIIEEILEDDLEGLTELVLVSHVINPCHFYIRRYSQKKEAFALQMKLESFCCSKSSYLLPSDTLELGARTFIKSKETGMWCRGTITELIPVESKSRRKKLCGPIRYKVCDVALLEVFLIDFGSSVVLIFSGCGPTKRPDPATLQTIETHDICLFVRKPDEHIEAELAAIPPLAVRCSLKDVVPKNEDEGWGEEAKTKFLEMVNNKVVSMMVFREEDGVLIVDLRKPPFNEVSSNTPLSLKDALVFLDLARFKLQIPRQLENCTISQYSPPNIPQEGEEVFVVVCHINSPSDFYLRLRESVESLALSEKIQEIYKQENGKNLEIFYPVEGQACVAKQEDGNWYRAQIIGLPSCQEVLVKYVDYGNIANLPHKDIRRVKQEFLSFPEKAIRCRLACIEPFEGAHEWNREAKERFEEMTEDKLMLCSVIEILDNDILSIELFNASADNGKKISINCQLVEEDLASYIPGYAERTGVKPNEIWDDPLEEISKTSEAFIPIDMESVDEGDFRSLCNKELHGRISYVVSPSKIFVQLLASESILKSLQEEMASIYRESQPQSVKWEREMHCAVYIRDVDQWQRGQIRRIVSETSAEVLLYDSGAEKTVEVSCLRKLEENMKTIRTLAIECSLTEIRPTGGSTEWTATVCECLSYYLTGAQVKIVIQKNDVGGALPVKILCKDETGKVTDTSEYLIEQGLALRNQRTGKADGASLVSKEHLEVHFEQENTQLDGCNSKIASARNRTVPEENATISESEQKSLKIHEPLPHSEMDEVYKSPIVPEAKIFQAVVSCIGGDGTIYIIPKSFETALNKMMAEIQNTFKGLGLLIPYCWKKGEACVVRGSDTVWYRGKIVEVSGSTLQVQYVDHGYIESIPQCHLYPTTFYTGIPLFCIPCQLYKTLPIGNFWQQEAVEYLQELLKNEEVEIHVKELPDNPWGKLSISLYFGGMSLSSFMAYQRYCVAEDCQNIEKQGEFEGNLLPSYLLQPLPVPGETFPVTVSHLVSPKEVYIRLDSSENLTKNSATERSASCDSESLNKALKWCNKIVKTLPHLTNFKKELPCLAEYVDGLWYRAKLLSITQLVPVQILVQFVDYGTYLVAPISRLRHIPCHLLKYPVQAVRVLLAGFRPASDDKNVERIPYSPEWSLKALWTMVDCVEGKHLFASILTVSPEVTISLYGEDKNLVHLKLIEMGLAELDQ